jgi:hypothetical protein
LNAYEPGIGHEPKMKRVVIDGLWHRKPQWLFRGKHSVEFLSDLLNLAIHRDQSPASTTRCGSSALYDRSLFHRFAHELSFRMPRLICAPKKADARQAEGRQHSIATSGSPATKSLIYLKLVECKTYQNTVANSCNN